VGAQSRLNNAYAKLTLSMLTLYVDGEGYCFVSSRSLADDTELSAQTVRDRLAWLEQVGAIAKCLNGSMNMAAATVMDAGGVQAT
jgi:response regulator of citrate/malate metabolism